MTAPELARKALKCLVVWRCADQKCGFELHKMPSHSGKCGRCGLESYFHGIFSDDRDGLVKLLTKEARRTK
jgi:hypothetical protein